MILDSQLTKIAPDATPSEILKAAKLDWSVEKCQRYYKLGDEFREVPGKYSLIRTDNGIELDTCSQRWHPAQNSEIVELAYEAFQSQNINISYAGSLEKGRYIALVAPWETTEIGTKNVGDIVDAKVIIIGSQKVGVGHSVKMYLNRLVCTNGMTSNMKINSKIIGHTNGAIKALTQSLETAEFTFNIFKERAGFLSQKPLRYIEAQALIIKEFGDPNKSVEEQPQLVKIVLDLFNGKGKGSELLTAYQTAWGLLNSLTEYYSNSSHSRSKDRLSSIIQGTGYQNTQRLQNSLFRYVQNRVESYSVQQSVML